MNKQQLNRLDADFLLIEDTNRGVNTEDSVGAAYKRKKEKKRAVYPYISETFANQGINTKMVTDQQVPKALTCKPGDKECLLSRMSDLYLIPGSESTIPYYDMEEWSETRPTRNHYPKKRYLKANHEIDKKNDTEISRLTDRWKKLNKQSQQDFEDTHEIAIPQDKDFPIKPRKDIAEISRGQTMI